MMAISIRNALLLCLQIDDIVEEMSAVDGLRSEQIPSNQSLAWNTICLCFSLFVRDEGLSV